MTLKTLLSFMFAIIGLLSAAVGTTVMDYARPEGGLPLACGFIFFIFGMAFLYKGRSKQERNTIILALSFIVAHVSLMSTALLHLQLPITDTTGAVVIMLYSLLYCSLIIWLAIKVSVKSLISMALFQGANLLLEIDMDNSAVVGTFTARIMALHTYLTANILLLLALWFAETLYQKWQVKKTALGATNQ
jgi:hypothetical protein